MILDFLVYLGKSSVATGVFYLAYVVLFRKQKHFDFNRIYLLVSLVVSFILPFITIPMVKLVDLATTENLSSTMVYLPGSTSKVVMSEVHFSIFHYLFGFFVLGILALLLHLIISHLKAVHIISNCRIVHLFDYPVHITTKDVHPFSFFDKIVLSEKILLSSDLEMIVNHEKIHVQEKHTVDIFLVELLFLLQWFNPFAWLLKDAVKNNLEYKTDDRITKKYDSQRYQLAMVALADKNEVSPFLSALNGSQLKNRIIMMKKKTTNKFVIAKQLVVIPLLAILIIGLSNKVAKTETVQLNPRQNEVVSGNEDETIDTSLKLRKAIAIRMKFPVIAASMKGELALSLYATISRSGVITNIDQQIAENTPFITLDEVVVTAYRSNEEPEKSEAYYRAVLSKEAKRVLEDIHKFDIPEMKGKVVKFQFKFRTE